MYRPMDIQSPIYIEHNVFVELGLVDLPDDQKSRLLEQMNTLVHKRLMLRLTDALPDEAATELEAVGEQGPDVVMDVLIKHVPNLPGMIVDEVTLVTDEMRAVIITELVA